jgi:hypothetical protein
MRVILFFFTSLFMRTSVSTLHAVSLFSRVPLLPPPQSSTTLDVVLPSPVSSSVTPTATSSARSSWWLPRACTLASLSTAARRVR